MTSKRTVYSYGVDHGLLRNTENAQRQAGFQLGKSCVAGYLFSKTVSDRLPSFLLIASLPFYYLVLAHQVLRRIIIQRLPEHP